MKAIQVLIADDEALVRHALRIFIGGDERMTVVGEARDGIEAVEQVGKLRPDIVLMDLQMPRMSGVEAISRIAGVHPRVRVLAITTFASGRFVVPALRAGAAGYLVKDTEPDDIIAAIIDVHAGRSVISPKITRELIDSIRTSDQNRPARTGGSTESLTSRELSIVRLIARGLSNAEIAAHLHLSEPTIKSNLGRVMTKWGVRDRVQVLIRAASDGVVEIHPLDPA